jgi:peptidoglycan hydrolase CwlO-like protein
MPIFYVILAVFCTLVSLSALILPFLLVSTAKSDLRSEFGDLKSRFETISRDVSAMQQRLDTLNTEHFENLLAKYKTITTDMTGITAKVESLDTSIRNFYSKWARKLGKVAESESAEQNSDAPENQQLPEEPVYPLAENQVPAEGYWARRKRQMKRRTA